MSRTGARRSRTIAGLAFVAAALAAFYLAPVVIRGYHFAIGADAPVYTWWARLAGHDGLSAIASRPGVPALVLVLGGTLNLSTTEAVAALGVALPVATGLAAAGLVLVAAGKRDPATPAWLLAGLFAGWYAANLANGYLASLAVAALFLAALAAVVRRRTVAAAVLLGAAGLCHPAFALIGVVVLLLAAGWDAVAVRRSGDGRAAYARSALGAVAGGVAVAGAGFLSLVAWGPGPVDLADTSKDAFLRRTGRTAQLHDLYRSRLASSWPRSLAFVYVPLAVLGAWAGRRAPEGPRAFARRALVAWAAVSAVGLVAAVVSGLVPGERFLSFAFTLPVLSAIGVAWLWTEGDRSRWRRVVAGLSVAVIAVGSVLAWRHAAQFFRDGDMAGAGTVASIAAALPPGTPIVVVVDEAAHAGFDVPRWGNELRSAVPPDRIRDVHVFVGSPADYLARRPARTGDPVRDELSKQYLADLERTLHGRAPTAIVVRPMNEPGFAEALSAGNPVGTDVVVLDDPAGGPVPLPDPDSPLRPSPVWRTVLACLAGLVLLGVVGLGWTRALVSRGAASVALAPAVGMAILLLAGLVVDRVGVRLTGPVPFLVSVVAGLGGFALARRRRGADQDGILEGEAPSSQPDGLDDRPHERHQ